MKPKNFKKSGVCKYGKLNNCDDCGNYYDCLTESVNKPKIEHLTCSVCNKAVTYLEDGELRHETFFEIKRSNYTLSLSSNLENGIVLENENTKMSRLICDDCFDLIVFESKLLQKIFRDKNTKQITY